MRRSAVQSKGMALSIAAPLRAITLAGTAPAQGQSMQDGWQFEAATFSWFPAVCGTSSFSTDGGGTSIDVSMGEGLDALKFAFIGDLQVCHGPWGPWNDLVYAGFGASRQRSRDFSIGGQPLPACLSANLPVDLKSWISTLAGTWALKSDDEGTMDMRFSARMLDLSNTLSWSLDGPAPARCRRRVARRRSAKPTGTPSSA